MATKTIAWGTGTGNITLTYSGQGNDTVTVTSDDNEGEERSQTLTFATTAGGTVTKVVTIVQEAYVAPQITVVDFEYTGEVQSIILPAGQYKLQVWGAQGGNVTTSHVATGSKGGYSEGIITLASQTKFFIFVGGQGTSGAYSTSTTYSGGWNGGGGAKDYANMHARGGGGATDIALVTSTMSYSSYKTNRSSASYLSRFIVAGGGAGASSFYASSSNYKVSNGSQVGGGTSGGGQEAGTQSAAGGTTTGYKGGFGYGGNAGISGSMGSSTRYSGGGGGGWYGGGAAYTYQGADNEYLNYGGGGSGFVNTSANSSYRPSNYTGLELASGATYSGDTSFPSPSGGTETGHSGNGYARITNLSEEKPYLTFIILTSGNIGWKASNSSLTKTIQYSKNGGEWTSITSATTAPTISVAAGDEIRLRGDNTAYGNSSYYNYFTSTCTYNAVGNVMSLIDSDDFEELTALSATYTFRRLFYNNTGLMDVSELLLPATTLQQYCYYQMFYGCTGFTKAPVLPATTLVGYCYNAMFRNCSNLNYVRCLATSGINTSNSTSNWLNSVASTGTFISASGSTWPSSVSGIPSGWTKYTKVSYIENVNSAYINTGINAANNIGIHIEYEDNYAYGSSSNYIVGARASSSSTILMGIVGSSTNNTMSISYNGGSTSYIQGTLTGYARTKGKKYVVDMQADSTGMDFTVVIDNGTPIIGRITATLSSSSTPICLFALNSSNIKKNTRMTCCRITQGGTVVRDFEPVTDGSSVAGMLDTANNVFYGSANSNTFTAASS